MTFRDEVVEAITDWMGDKGPNAHAKAEQLLGWLLSYRQTVNCETCRGTGTRRVWTDAVLATCKHCSGSGRVRSESPRVAIVCSCECHRPEEGR